MSAYLGGYEFYRKTYYVCNDIQRKDPEESVPYHLPEAPSEVECDIVLVADIPYTEKGAWHKGYDYCDHYSLQIDTVPYV